MNTREAMQALLDGKKITRECWEPDWYICIKDGHIRNHNNNTECLTSFDYELYEEKPVLEKDPYVGKQLINKHDTNSVCIIVRNDCDRHYVTAHGMILTIEDIRGDWYIEGEDF